MDDVNHEYNQNIFFIFLFMAEAREMMEIPLLKT